MNGHGATNATIIGRFLEEIPWEAKVFGFTNGADVAWRAS
jgi:hypothetical protein